jgi:HlyD family secretion protein
MISNQTKRRALWGGIGLILLLGLAYSLAPKPVPADFARVVTGPLLVTLDHDGRTRIRDPFAIAAPVDGRVGRIELEPGTPVKEGESVVHLWPSEPVLLDPRSHSQAEAEADGARSQLTGAIAERDRVRGTAELAARDRERMTALVGDGIVSAADADRAESEADAAARALVAAEAGVRTARYQLSAAEAWLEVTADARVEGRALILHSPIDGVVLRRQRQSESPVRAGEVLIEVGDPRDLEVIADYLSTDAVQIRPGMRAILSQWGGDHELAGHVRLVEPAGFMKVSALGVEEQRVDVRIAFDDPYAAWNSLGDDYRVEVQVVIWESESVTKVPTNSLFREGSRWAVFTVEDDEARLQPVEIGHRTPREAEVLSGLSEGAVVLAHPSEAIHSGVDVTPREP